MERTFLGTGLDDVWGEIPAEKGHSKGHLFKGSPEMGTGFPWRNASRMWATFEVLD